MNKKKIILYFILILIIIGVAIFAGKLFADSSNSNKNENICVDIIKNVDKNVELNLSARENEKYYYFDIVNFNSEEQKYNSTEIIPYLKIDLGKKNTYINYELYALENENDTEDKWVKITEKGEEGSSFEKYYKANIIKPYNQENLEENTAHYVLKISLNTKDDAFIDLEEDLTNDLSIVLGYKENK